MKKREKRTILGVLVVVLLMMMLISACAEPTPENINDAGSNDDPGNQMVVNIEQWQNGESTIEYVQIGRLPDEGLQEVLNDSLRSFSVGAAEYDDANAPVVTGETQFAIIGDRYLSVRTVLTSYVKDAAYPQSVMLSQIFDLTTGVPAGSVSDFIKVGEELREAITSGVFVQTYPAVIEGAPEAFAEAFVDNFDTEYYDLRFYLTETGVGLYVNDRIHAEGDYWTFEANYNEIRPLLTQKLLDVID